MNEIEWETCLLETRPSPEFEARFRRETGRPGGLMRFWADSDWMSDTIVRLSVQLTTYVVLDPDLADQSGLVVSQDNSCRFCFGAQGVLLRALGMSEERIARLEQQALVGEISPRDRAALNYARKVSRAQPLASPDELDALRAAGFSRLEIAELTGHVATHLFFNRISTFAALPPERWERLSEAWWLRAFRPIVKPYFQRMRRSDSTVASDPTVASGAFGFVLREFDGLAMANTFRNVVDGALALESISPRTPALVFAVVSRALGCRASEAESRRLLVEKGTSREETDEILTHLASPGLSEAEQVAVGFARETVWYTPAPVQRRCRAVKEQLGNEPFVELIGVCALANSICRLAVITGNCE